MKMMKLFQRKYLFVGLMILFTLPPTLIYRHIYMQQDRTREVKDFVRSAKKTKAQESTSHQQPHIIFILSDDMGYNDIGYHNSEIRTPTLDMLAYNGVRLENYYVQPICTPTRAQLLSGRYQIHLGLQHGIIRPNSPNGLPLDSPTIADKMKESGYSTHMVGKWHVGSAKKAFLPTKRGFDTFFGYLCGSENYFFHTQRYNGKTGLDLWNNMEPVRNESRHYSTHLFTEKVINIIRGHKKGSKPLFIYLPYQAVHAPFEVPDHYLSLHPHIQDETRRTLAGMASAMDEGIANITAELRRKGMWQNTVLIFSTDNGAPQGGPGSNLPLRGSKGTMMEGGIRGVGFVSSPLLRDSVKGTISKELMHVTDWYPTMVHLAKGNLKGTKPLDGYNQWDTIQNLKSSPRKEILHNIDPIIVVSGRRLYNDTFDNRILAAIRVGDWKLFTAKEDSTKPKVNKDRLVWLYNIKNDPYETKDLSESNEGKVRELLKRLQEYDKTSVPCMFPDEDPRANPEFNDGMWGPWL